MVGATMLLWQCWWDVICPTSSQCLKEYVVLTLDDGQFCNVYPTTLVGCYLSIIAYMVNNVGKWEEQI